MVQPSLKNGGRHYGRASTWQRHNEERRSRPLPGRRCKASPRGAPAFIINSCNHKRLGWNFLAPIVPNRLLANLNIQTSKGIPADLRLSPDPIIECHMNTKQMVAKEILHVVIVVYVWIPSSSDISVSLLMDNILKEMNIFSFQHVLSLL